LLLLLFCINDAKNSPKFQWFITPQGHWSLTLAILGYLNPWGSPVGCEGNVILNTVFSFGNKGRRFRAHEVYSVLSRKGTGTRRPHLSHTIIYNVLAHTWRMSCPLISIVQTI
jgi:hypothetical protein